MSRALVLLVVAGSLHGAAWSRPGNRSRPLLNQALVQAVWRGNAPEVERLLNQGADPNARDRFLKCAVGMTREAIRSFKGRPVLLVARDQLAWARARKSTDAIEPPSGSFAS